MTRDRLGAAEVLRPAAAAGLPDVAPVPLLVLHPVPARILALSPGNEIPGWVPPSQPFAK